MKITLTQPEIEQAVREFVSKGGLSVNGVPMVVEFSMGRGENGLTASIDVPYMGVSSLPVTATFNSGFEATGPLKLNTQASPSTYMAKQETVVQATNPVADSAPTESADTDMAPAEQPATVGASLFGTKPAS